MLSRRRLMQLGLSTGAALALPAAAEDSPIGKLQSLKSKAVPITPAERQSRLEKARYLMQEHQLDALLVMAGTSLRYFTGIDWFESERFMVMALPAKSAPFYVSPPSKKDAAASRSPTVSATPRLMFASGRKIRTRIQW